jgi:hypothetical protein
VVVTYETGPEQRALVVEAARRGVPSIGLMHGMIFDRHYDYMHARVSPALRSEPSGFVVPTTTCVWGSYWTGVLVETGSYPSAAVAATGSPRSDFMRGVSERLDRQALREELGFAESEKVVLVLTATEDLVEVVTAAVNAARMVDGARPVLKLHPNQTVERIRGTVDELGLDASCIYTDKLLELIVASDVVVSHFSTAAQEAMLIGRPLVLASFGGEAWRAAPFLGTGLVRLAESPDDLERELVAALNDDGWAARTRADYAEFIATRFAGLDGRSAERVGAVVDDLARRYASSPR